MKQIFKYLAFALILVFTSCRDEFPDSRAVSIDDNSTVENENSKPGLECVNGLWKANRRVPLVGEGRTIGNMSAGLVSLLAGHGDLNNILDYDLENKSSLAGLATVDAIYQQILSVKDLYRTYSGGQKAGFVYDSSGTDLLDVEVIKLFTISLYNDGKLLETFRVSESGGVLGLNLINVSTAGGNAQQVVAVDVPEDMSFDEIAIGYGGADIGVLGSMNIYYAFVGETPVRTTVKNPDFDSNYYQNAAIYHDFWSSWTNWANADDLTDDSETNGPVIELIGGALNFIGGGYKVTVDFREKVPAGSEVGFVFTTGDVLNLGIGSTVSLSTYNVKNDEPINKEIESYTVGNVLGASAIGGGKGSYSFITTEDFQAVFMRIIGLNVKVGTTQYLYAYTRAKTEVDITSYFNFPSTMTVNTSGLQILKPEYGNLTNVTITGPEGSSPKWLANESRLSEMTETGEYTVTFTYELDGKTFTQISKITREASGTSPDGCNQLITSGNIKNTGDWGICVICGNAKDTEKLLDDDVNSCMTYYGALELLANQNIVTVEKISGLADIDYEYRAGFIMQVSKELLSLNALNFLYVKLYKNGQEVDTSVSGTRPTVDLGLINGDQGKVRIGVTVPAGKGGFDEIRLYNAGVLALNFNTIRLYGVFYEPANLNCSSNGVAEACMEMVTPATAGAHIDYNTTNFKSLAGVANGMYSLDNVLDDDKNTAVTIATTNVAGESVLAVKFNQMPAGQWIGAIIQDQTGIADIDLLDALTFEVYNNGIRVAEYTNDANLVNASLIGHDDKVYLELQPDQPFDEVRISGRAVGNLLDQLSVYGIYTRVDADGDGIPDCGEPEEPVETDEIYLTVNELHTCCTDQTDLEIPVTGGKPDKTYTLVFYKHRNEYDTANLTDSEEYKVTYKGDGKLIVENVLPGVYSVDFYPENYNDNDKPYFNKLPVYVHPEKTTWKGGIEGKPNEWNLWDNWSQGTPWGCTDVVIPAGLENYPILTDTRNYCNRIQFGAGQNGKVGKVVNTQYLTYELAWVDRQLEGGQYYLLSSPLKDTYTGDVFGAFEEPVTVDFNGDYNYENAWIGFKENITIDDFRFNPQVYQRTFGGFINNQTGSGTEQLQPGEKNWTPPFNLVAQEYGFGKAFLVKMGDNGSYMLRWPKLYTSYEYYDEKSVISGRAEQVSRTNAGRFIHEDSKGVTEFPLHVKLENDRPGDTYLTGNPFMADIDVKMFFDANLGVGEVWLLRNGRYTTIKRNDESISEIISEIIQPMEGFLIKLRSPYSETNRYSYYVNFTDGMLKQ